MSFRSKSVNITLQFITVVLVLMISNLTYAQSPNVELSSIVGKEIQEQIKGLESDEYQISLKRGQYLQIFVATEKLAVEVNLIAPSGENVFRLETDNKKNQREVIEIIAKLTGSYKLEVNALDNTTSESTYKIQVSELRRGLLKDRNRCQARELTTQANLLQKIGTKVGFQASVERYLASLKYWEKSGDKIAEADVFRKLGESYFFVSNYQEALKYFTKELDFRRANNDKSREARGLKNLGFVYYSMGVDEQALEYYSQALSLGKETNNKEVIAQTLSFLARFHNSQGERKQSIDYNKQALALWQELEEKEESIKTAEELATSYYSLAEIKDSIEFYKKTLQGVRDFADKKGEINILNALAIIYDEVGDFLLATNYYQQALEKSQNLRSSRSLEQEIEILNNLGQICYKQKDLIKAEGYFEQALALAQEKQDPVRQAKVLNNLANIYRDNGDSSKAIEIYSDVLRLHRANNDLANTVVTAIAVGQTHLDLGDGEKAVGFFTEAYKLNQRGGNRDLEANIFYHLGRALEFVYEEEKALASYKEGVNVSQELKDQLREAQFRYRLARLQFRRGDIKTAQGNITTAISLVEALQSNLINQKLQISYSNTTTDYYKLYVDLLMQQHQLNPKAGNDITALAINEQAKAHSLLDLTGYSLDGDLISQERELKQLISNKTERLIKLNINESVVTEITAAENELKALNDKLKACQTALQKQNPHYTEFAQPKAFSLAELQQQLDTDTLLLEYELGTDHSYLWLISKTEVKSFFLPKRSEIESKVKYLRDLLVARNLLVRGQNIGGRPISLDLAENEYPKVAAEVSKLLLSPVADQLAEKRLVIVTDGAIQYIPFNALPDPNKADVYEPLILKHEIVSLPSASTINTLRKEAKDNKNTKAIMLVADPVFSASDSRVTNKSASNKINNNGALELETTSLLIKKSAKEVGLPVLDLNISRLKDKDDEVKEISALVPIDQSKQVLGFDAKVANLLAKEASDYRVIHFATYGLANSIHPELSGIVLSLVNEQGKLEDGFLQTHKIFNLKLPEELVTISACETNIGENAQAEGLSGLTRGFIYAGASRVMVSLWNGDSAANTKLMKSFYQKILKDGKSPSVALRDTQLELWKEYKSPFYWAAFQLQGEWK
ncbi:MAG: CHAT domain-containing protein [Blastocatellia bacterium]|nr:CHAT domain-containing protein [Blastocatellia bacterium]